MKPSFLGAAREVTGSWFLWPTGGLRQAHQIYALINIMYIMRSSVYGWSVKD
jgi:hypothetical protein